MPLRTRILIVTVTLFLAGIAAANVATYHFVSTFLVHRVDDQLRADVRPVAAALTRTAPAHPGAHGLFLPDGSYAALFDARGRVRREARFAFGQETPRPRIPGDLIGSRDAKQGPKLATVSAQRGGAEYRVIAASVGDQRTVVVALPLREVNATKRLLLLIGGIVSGLVVVALGGAAYWLTRRELRPLERMAEKSRAIAAGDLSQRVVPDDPSTEVGQLGDALNAMLSEIESAFAERLEAEERLRQFVADASHELRTPVTAIRGYAELFRRGASDRPDDLASVMRWIEQEGERMGALVDELLLLARLDHRLPLEHDPVDMAGVVEAAVGAARTADPRRPVELDAESGLVVLGSEQRLRQVVDNLLTNARVHTPCGTPIDVRLAAERGEAVLEVADAGPGVPIEEVERIFDRFYRTDRSRARSEGGAGLGLAIVRSVVEAHEGTVGYRPRPGGGSVFCVMLPLAQLASGGGSRPEKASEPAERPLPA